MKTLIAIRDIRYAGKGYKPGEVFNASERDAKILVAIGKVQYDFAPANVSIPKASVLIHTAPVVTLVQDAVSVEEEETDQSNESASAYRPNRSKRRNR